MRVEVSAELLQWACDRSRLPPDLIAERFPKLREWITAESQPTLKQLEALAKALHTPIGYLFLPKPPVETLPIPDFRTVANIGVSQPSPNLLDTVYLCQQRQEWFVDFARTSGEQPLAFVGSANLDDDIEETAAAIRAALNFDIEERRRMPTWAEALRRFAEQADTLGVLVMTSGVVANNNRRRLDPNEFRGFALAHNLAPLVFINGADTKSGQMFTLAHELAHIWLGQSALSDMDPISAPSHKVERWCDRVAAEVLVPLGAVRREIRKGDELWGEVSRLARHFKVSTLVVLRRMHDAGGLSREALWTAYETELNRLRRIRKDSSGGDFYLTQAARVGKRFARALVVSTLEGQTLHHDAFRLLGFSKLATFRELGRSLGVEAA